MALLVFFNERHYNKKDSSSSTMSFTNPTTKTELIKRLQNFALNVKMYKNLISTQNVVNFLETHFALFVLSNERYYYKKDSTSSTMTFTNLTTKTELVKSLQHFALNVKMYKSVISMQNVR